MTRHPILDNAAYNKMRGGAGAPLFKEAVIYLKKGIQLDPDHTHNALPDSAQYLL